MVSRTCLVLLCSNASFSGKNDHIEMLCKNSDANIIKNNQQFVISIYSNHMKKFQYHCKSRLLGLICIN